MERRKESRSKANTRMRVNVAGIPVVCVVRNLSASGCMIEGGALPGEVGATAQIELLPGLKVSGSVAWQLGESMGIFFDEPIEQYVVNGIALDDWPMKEDWSQSQKSDLG